MSNLSPTPIPATSGHGGRRFRTWHSGLVLVAVGACLVVAGSLRTTSSTLAPTAGSSATEPAATEPDATEPDATEPAATVTDPIVTDTVITTPGTEPATTTLPATTTTAAPAAITTTSQVQVLPVATTVPALVSPATLPRSGAASTPLISLGVGFIVVGLTLVVVSRARERRAAS